MINSRIKWTMDGKEIQREVLENVSMLAQGPQSFDYRELKVYAALACGPWSPKTRFWIWLLPLIIEFGSVTKLPGASDWQMGKKKVMLF